MNPFAWGASYLQSALSDLSYVAALERLGRVLIPRVKWRGDPRSRRIALTFDDGPHPDFTPRLLDILGNSGVPATFFMIGRYVERFRPVVQEVARRGHETANHTYTHPILFGLGDLGVVSEIRRTHDRIADVTGVAPQFLRPPMGLFSKRVLDRIEECGYQTVVGDVYPRDPHLPGTVKIVDRVMKRAQNGSIIILHDGGNTPVVDRSQTLEAVRIFVPRLQQMGYEFVTLSRLLSYN